jgi:hypothetical protein
VAGRMPALKMGSLYRKGGPAVIWRVPTFAKGTPFREAGKRECVPKSDAATAGENFLEDAEAEAPAFSRSR